MLDEVWKMLIFSFLHLESLTKLESSAYYSTHCKLAFKFVIATAVEKLYYHYQYSYYEALS